MTMRAPAATATGRQREESSRPSGKISGNTVAKETNPGTQVQRAQPGGDPEDGRWVVAGGEAVDGEADRAGEQAGEAADEGRELQDAVPVHLPEQDGADDRHGRADDRLGRREQGVAVARRCGRVGDQPGGEPADGGHGREPGRRGGGPAPRAERRRKLE